MRDINLTWYMNDFQAEVDRLWPGETIQERGNCLAEETGEVNRAITKRRHAIKNKSGKCKGMTVEDWTDNLHKETMQTLGVALSICAMEGFDPVEGLLEALSALQRREPDPDE